MKNPHKHRLLETALLKKTNICLPEVNHDSRVYKASKILSNYGLKVVLIDDLALYKSKYLEIISNKKFTNNWTTKMIKNYIDNPVNFSLCALENGDVDSVVCGASTSTGDVIRSAVRIVGVKPDARWVSSIFYMISSDYNHSFSFADCAVIPEPTSKQLCSIAYESSQFHKKLSGEDPKIAFLSFSTHGSSSHYKVKRVQEAVKLFSKKYPDVLHEGELQFDAAFNVEVAIKKNKMSKLKGNANVFIFPDLDSGNISYKITQYLGGYSAWGPLLQGLNKTVHDLSRGCTVNDIVSIGIIAALK